MTNEFERAQKMITQALARMDYALNTTPSAEEASAFADLAVQDLKTALAAMKAVSRDLDAKASPSYIAMVRRD